MPCRVLVVDDDPLISQLIALMLGEQDDIEVVGQAGDGLEALQLVERLAPDVVTMDLEMPRMNGVEATARIQELDLEPAPRVVVVSSSLFADAIAESRRVGAHGYVTKSKIDSDLVRVIRAACRGEAFQAVS